MDININEEICKKYGLDVSEVLAVLLIKTCNNIPKLFSILEEKEIVVKDILQGYMITQKWDDTVSTILLDSDVKAPPSDRIESLAIQLMEVFPKQKKVGTCHYFRGNKKDIILRLKKFFKLYGKYTDEQIVTAAKKYVESFNGDYSYMRILKYFIWKDEVKINSEGDRYVDEVSDLANWIENAGQEENLRDDWTSSLS